ncbi:2OG-Fe(II) oxygenase [Dichotomopilus funicola]|uniref:2OG-Fe(II) oxygenase n=1 Tax=Dichotomopilus funicola TaxID=1934379 RepID=A0AAN6V8P5_9PEZI|nr:2OG-Fe(II) oxygenase [Dichotomopilus funicola]
MGSVDIALPLIDLSGYIRPDATEESRQRVIDEVRDACEQFGFFQATGHGVDLALQKGLLQSLDTFFGQSKEEKLKLSFLSNSCRRGYEASGMSIRDGDPLADSKEAFYIGPEDAEIEPPGLYGPNVWPTNLPGSTFRDPVWAYYEATFQLGRTIWEILLQGLGHPATVLDVFAKRPLVPMKMIRYPPASQHLPGQFGVGAHTDFGGVTVLLQEPGKEGLEVWHEEARPESTETTGSWVPVPAIENVYVINCGDMIQRWSTRRYKSARHRVVNKADVQRLSCATFWHGDLYATDPLNPGNGDTECIGQLLFKRFKNQFSFTKDVAEQLGPQAQAVEGAR